MRSQEAKNRGCKKASILSIPSFTQRWRLTHFSQPQHETQSSDSSHSKGKKTPRDDTNLFTFPLPVFQTQPPTIPTKKTDRLPVSHSTHLSSFPATRISNSNPARPLPAP